MKRILRNVFLTILLLGTTVVVFSGCAGNSYSKGFDEAD